MAICGSAKGETGVCPRGLDRGVANARASKDVCAGRQRWSSRAGDDTDKEYIPEASLAVTEKIECRSRIGTAKGNCGLDFDYRLLVRSLRMIVDIEWDDLWAKKQSRHYSSSFLNSLFGS